MRISGPTQLKAVLFKDKRMFRIPITGNIHAEGKLGHSQFQVANGPVHRGEEPLTGKAGLPGGAWEPHEGELGEERDGRASSPLGTQSLPAGLPPSPQPSP